ncbi:unnamed protein product [Cuscuta campestris]|uniref:RING-type E3 ubiquitin transferase n=1 Tax=Cuscuta campestris TaxID=132261 RepID=A0A484KUU9_9ASTE|nr:unnamed protein product [Cuscuta campestris]
MASIPFNSTSLDSASPPLLRPLRENNRRSRSQSLAALMGRVTGRRGASMLVRQTAARELEERRADWGYSKPVVALDMMWNLAFVFVSAVMLGCTLDESPNVPIRVWVCGYELQCLVHVVLVWFEYSRRNSPIDRSGEDGASMADGSEEDDEEEMIAGLAISSRSSVAKRWESVNTMASFGWWMIGFYWVISGGEMLLRNAPRLYWLAVVFLAFDVFFAIFCVVLACLIGIALCCCLPCIIAILYAVAGQEGASEADLNALSKYRFLIRQDNENPFVGGGKMVPIDPGSGYLATERFLLPEDAECCICLSSYEDGTELHTLPCSHHFHTVCIVKWLKMNATCPLCKFNILKGNEQV